MQPLASGAPSPSLRSLTAPIGSRVGGWEVLRLLGRGGVADVYLVRPAEDGEPDLGGGAPRALKLLRAGGPVAGARFRREAEVLASLDHPGIPCLHEVGEHAGRPYFVMDWVEGPDLGRYAETLRRRSPEERLFRVRAIAEGLCDLLAHVHGRGIVHRDLKPQNVLLDAAGRPRLIDFGVCFGAESATVRPEPSGRYKGLLGTPAVAAPEQLGVGVLGPAVDQYGLGCTLHLLLTGTRVFGDLSGPGLLRAHLAAAPGRPSGLDPTIPEPLEAVVLRLLAKRPEDRFSDVAAVARALVDVGGLALSIAGRQPQIDALAAVIREPFVGGFLHITGAPGAGRRWLASLARDAADRAEIQWFNATDAPSLAEARARAAAGEVLLVLVDQPCEGAVTLDLPPLSRADVRRTVFGLDTGLTCRAAGAETLASRAERLWLQSGGNPRLLLLAYEAETSGEAVDVGPWLDLLGALARRVASRLAWVTDCAAVELADGVEPGVVEAVLGELSSAGVAIRRGDRWRLAAELLRAPLRAAGLPWGSRAQPTFVADAGALRERVDSALDRVLWSPAAGLAASAEALALAGDRSVAGAPGRPPSGDRLLALLGRALALVLVGAAEAATTAAEASAEAHARGNEAGRVAAHTIRARSILDGVGEPRGRASAAIDRLFAVRTLAAPAVLDAWREAIAARAAAARDDRRGLDLAVAAALRALERARTPPVSGDGAEDLPGLLVGSVPGAGGALVVLDLTRALVAMGRDPAVLDGVCELEAGLLPPLWAWEHACLCARRDGRALPVAGPWSVGLPMPVFRDSTRRGSIGVLGPL